MVKRIWIVCLRALNLIMITNAFSLSLLKVPKKWSAFSAWNKRWKYEIDVWLDLPTDTNQVVWKLFYFGHNLLFCRSDVYLHPRKSLEGPHLVAVSHLWLYALLLSVQFRGPVTSISMWWVCYHLIWSVCYHLIYIEFTCSLQSNKIPAINLQSKFALHLVVNIGTLMQTVD